MFRLAEEMSADTLPAKWTYMQLPTFRNSVFKLLWLYGKRAPLQFQPYHAQLQKIAGSNSPEWSFLASSMLSSLSVF